MSFVGLDFGKAGNIYADLLRQAHQEKIKQNQWEAQNRIQQQQAAALYGLPVEEDMFVSSPVELDMIARAPQSEEEANLLAADLAAGVVGQKQTQLPTGPRVQGSLSVPDQPPPKGTPVYQGGPMALNVGQAKKQVEPLEQEQEKQQRQVQELFDAEINQIINQAQKAGLVKDGKVHPYVARQVQALREQRLKALTSGGRSLYDLALLEAMRQQRPVRSGTPRTIDPNVTIRRKIQSLKDARAGVVGKSPAGYIGLSRKQQQEVDNIDREIADLARQIK